MVGTFKNKALRRLWEKNQTKGLNTDHLRRIKDILSMLDAAESLADLNVPGYHLHALKHLRPVRHSMRVTGNWRITFLWKDGAAQEIDYEDYH